MKVVARLSPAEANLPSQAVAIILQDRGIVMRPVGIPEAPYSLVVDPETHDLVVTQERRA